MTNGEIVNNLNFLNQLRTNSSMSFSATVAYAIVRNIKILESYATDIFKTQKTILDKYTKPSKEEGYYEVNPGCEDKVLEMLSELEGIENDVTIQKISLESLEGNKLTIEEMANLYFMVDG